MLTIRDLIPDFTAFKSATTKALEDTKAALAERDKQFSAVTAELEAIKASLKAKADDTTDDSSDEPSELVTFVTGLLDYIKKAAPDADESADDSDTSDDSTDDANNSSDDSAQATVKAKLHAVKKSLSKIIASNKAAKAAAASIPELVAKETQKVLAQIGIPAPVATAPEGSQNTRSMKPDGSKRAHKLIRDGFNEDPAVANLNKLLGRK